MARLTLIMAIPFMLLAGAIQPAVGDVYYAEDFTEPPDPPWDTNNPSRYYRDPVLGVYRGIMYDDTNEYGTVPLPWNGGSFTLSFDVQIDSMNWAGDFNFGWFDETRECFYHSPQRQMFKLSFGIGDLGQGISMYAWDSAGAAHETGEYPTSAWSLDVWYEVGITYDDVTRTLFVEMREAETGLLKYSDALSGISGFDNLAHLGLSKVSDTYVPSACGSGWIDNIQVVPEPASLSFLSAAALLVLRRR